MPESVVIVDEAFFNDKRLQHTGVLICHTVGGIPTVCLFGYNEDGQIFEFPQDGEFKTPELETGQFFVNQELRMFGFFFEKFIHRKKKSLNINFYIILHSYYIPTISNIFFPTEHLNCTENKHINRNKIQTNVGQ